MCIVATSTYRKEFAVQINMLYEAASGGIFILYKIYAKSLPRDHRN